MTKIFDGYLLGEVRKSPSNSSASNEANRGVWRDVKPIPTPMFLPAPAIVDSRAEQYRTKFLLQQGVQTDYLLFASNNGNLGNIGDASWVIDQGTIVFSSQGLTVQNSLSPLNPYTDGADTILFWDQGFRTLFSVVSVKIRRGDNSSVVTCAFDMIQVEAGTATFDATTLANLGGGISAKRGDLVTEFLYALTDLNFSWSKNDNLLTRFGWDSRNQKWSPFLGMSIPNLGILGVDTSFKLFPLPQASLGTFLTGSSLTDQYSMIRVGYTPDESSVPVVESVVPPFSGIFVVSDSVAEETYDFSLASPPYAGVIGETSGILQWNPSFLNVHVGEKVWYYPKSFTQSGDGLVGEYTSNNLYISPIPPPTDKPLLRIGSRRYLQVKLLANETLLSAWTVVEGNVAVALSTGRVKLSPTDIAKASIASPIFDPNFLRSNLYYDGLVCCQKSQPVRNSIKVLDSGGGEAIVGNTNVFYIPEAQSLVDLGKSGVVFTPDQTGAIPQTGDPGVRPGGDNLVDVSTGLLRDFGDIGDLLVFSKKGVMKTVHVVDRASDVPLFDFSIPEGECYLVKEKKAGEVGSRLVISANEKTDWQGENIYFMQAEVSPSVYTETAQIYSFLQEPFVFSGNEIFVFGIDGFPYTWNSSLLGAGSFSASIVAASIQTVISGTGACTSYQGRLLIQAGNLLNGFIEIGFGSFAGVDLSGCSALGFLPGWFVDTTGGKQENWLPDSGLSFGVFRSAKNLDRQDIISDYVSHRVVNDEVLQNDVSATPQVFLIKPPLLDSIGYGKNQVLQQETETSVGGVTLRSKKILSSFYDILPNFDGNSFSWLETDTTSGIVTLPTSFYSLGKNQIVPETLESALGGSFQVASSGNVFVPLQAGTDFLVDEEGATGYIRIVEEVGAIITEGFKGSFTTLGTLFTASDGNFLSFTIEPGDKLQILEENETAYEVVTVSSGTTLQITPAFTHSSTSFVPWKVFKGATKDEFDPSLVVDIYYDIFNHLPEETFVIRKLQQIGVVPASVAAQAANPLQADITETLERGRLFFFRIETGGVDLLTTLLQKQKLGVLANFNLFLPDITGTHFLSEKFDVQIGSQTFTHGSGKLLKVAVFSNPVATDEIEYLESTGEVRFGADILLSLAGSTVFYKETFLDATALSQGNVLVNPDSQEILLSSSDLSGNAGLVCYLVEQMITENRVDVAISPLAAGFTFLEPLKENQIIEAEYDVADLDGNQLLDEEGNIIHVKEFLPVYLRLEEATRIDGFTYEFNPTQKTILQDVEPFVYVDADLQNIGSTTAYIDFSQRQILFVSEVDVSSVVKISYAVYETFGGEADFTASQRPIYRPPFFITKNQAVVSFQGDRTSDILVGKLLRVGEFLFYIKTSSFDTASNLTSVGIYPPPNKEIGSHAPGNDILSLITNIPVTTIVDPSSPVTIPTAPAGFYYNLSAVYQDIPKNSRRIFFLGDVRKFAVAGHVLEILGKPFLITDVVLSSEGSKTVVEIAVGVLENIPYQTGAMRISVRPIYPPSPREFFVVTSVEVPGYINSAIIEEGSVEAFLFEGSLPGRKLLPERDYKFDADQGILYLISPEKSFLQGSDKIYVRYVRNRALSAFKQEDIIIYPRYLSVFRFQTSPSSVNGILHSKVRGFYQYFQPDNFYVSVAPLSTIVDNLLSDKNANSQIPKFSLPSNLHGTTSNYTLAIPSQNSDKVARAFLDYYNQLIQAFEQILEVIEGVHIGDRSGKFKFFVGRSRTWPTPGYENDFTGGVTTKNLWSDAFQSASTLAKIFFTFEDDIIDPRNFTLSGGVVSGLGLSAENLDLLMRQQLSLAENDIDDMVLTNLRDGRLVLNFPLIQFLAKGLYQRLGGVHKYSRLFPEITKTFFTTYPGIGATSTSPGVYAFSKTIPSPGFSFSGTENVTVSTNDKTIAKVSNQSLGDITNIVSLNLKDRLPRGRVWGYSSTGYPYIDISTLGYPTFIVAVVPLSEIPINTSTQLPDTSKLISQGGSIFDLASGNPSFSTPKWLDYSDKTQLALGKPNGDIRALGYAGTTLSIFGIPRLGPIYVDKVLKGSLVTLKSKDLLGNDIPITDASQILEIGSDGISGNPLSATKGDSLLVVPLTGETQELQDPPTIEDLTRLGQSSSFYRSGFDYYVRNTTGEIIEISFPSFSDPTIFGFKEIFGQHPPKPLTQLEGVVQFVNGNTSPANLPALLGLEQDDSGDQAIPYLFSESSEKELLNLAEIYLRSLLEKKSLDTTQYVYPDEILVEDGESLLNLSGTLPPSTLITNKDVTPVANGSPEEGIADAQRYDLLLVEVDDTFTRLQKGAQGILSVGEVTYDSFNTKSWIEPPRFVTSSRKGDRIRYVFNHAMCHISGAVSGVEVFDNGTDLIFDIVSVGGLVWNDGVGSSFTGGLNHLFTNTAAPFPNTNLIEINFFDAAGNLIETLSIKGALASALGAPAVLTSTPLCDERFLLLPGASGALGLAPAPGVYGFFDFSVSIDTTNGFTYSPNAASITGYVDDDRLTFHESYDLRTVKPRGFITGVGYPVEGSLGVYTVEGPTSTVITVNHPNNVNGGQGFTFVTRDYGIGKYTYATSGGAGDEFGSVKTMAFEGYPNVPVLPNPGQTIRCTLLTSSDKDENSPDATGVICTGEGKSDAIGIFQNRVTEITASAGAVWKVQKGDVLVIDRASGGAQKASTQVGTYLVRHAVEADIGVGGKYVSYFLEGTAGSASWLNFEFPKVVSLDSTGSGKITISDVFPFGESPTSSGYFKSSGWIYLITLVNGKDSQVVSAEYSSISSVVGGYEFTLTGGLGKYKDTDGLDIPLLNLSTDFWGKISVGMNVSGMVFLPIHLSGFAGILPNNLVGYHDGATAVFGLKYLTIFNDTAASVTKGFADFVDVHVGTGYLAPTVDKIGIDQFVKQSSDFFVPDVEIAVYDYVPALLDLSALDKHVLPASTFWATIHTKVGVQCIVPGDTFLTSQDTTKGAGKEGFLAQAGIFVEPSVPQSVCDLFSANPHVVDSSHNLTLTEIGMRDAGTFSAGSPEGVHFSVRRIRRFHDAFNQIGDALTPLQYLYKMRRGVVTAYTPGDKQVDTILAAGGTNLGDFYQSRVSNGSTLRILDSSGNLIEEVKIVQVLSAVELLVSPRPEADPTGKNFEIYLHQVPVPHEQSFAQIKDLITDAMVLQRSANYSTQTGGYVPADWSQRNTLFDDLITGVGTNTYVNAGVKVGDILLVDPAGTLSGPTGQPIEVERGQPSGGDLSVIPRGAPYNAGRPSPLDDNRGFYRVVQVNTDNLVVSPENTFASSSSPYKIFPLLATDQTTYGYAVYPTVHASLIGTSGEEGQMDLRPTALAGTAGASPNSFKDTLGYSVRPFSYEIIRPTNFLSEAAVDFILSSRERFLSFLEKIEIAIRTTVYGGYFEFQRDNHIEDLPSVFDLTKGKGILMNYQVLSLRGYVSVAPYTSSRDILSILDRRFWIKDESLDLQTPTGSIVFYTDYNNPTGGSKVRPVLRDWLDLILDIKEKLREKRFAWLDSRVNRQDGTLILGDRSQAEQERYLEQQRLSQSRQDDMKKG